LPPFVASPSIVFCWVEVYEYNLGFYIFQILGQTNPNEKDYDDKYIMGVKGLSKKIHEHSFSCGRGNKNNQISQFFTCFETNFVKELITKKMFNNK
jgi:hypothetical protein